MDRKLEKERQKQHIEALYRGRYEILQEIGHGGMSTIYLAKDENVNRLLAIKVVRKDGRDPGIQRHAENSIRKEVYLLAGLDHPALPHIIDSIDAGNNISVVMEYIEGKSLDKVVQELGRDEYLSERNVIDWVIQVADALAYLHSRKPQPIIHRDMKPSNIMLKPDEKSVKLIDFGIARTYKDDQAMDTEVGGTRGYMAPESQLQQSDARSDIYSLGLTMHTLLTKWDPRVDKRPYMPVRHLRPELMQGTEYIIDRCVHPDPDQRYQNCMELIYDLRNVDKLNENTKRNQKRRLGAFVAAAALSVTMLFSGIGFGFAATQANNSTYDALISVIPSMELNEKINSYISAISVYPGDPRAYLKILEAYEDAGSFTNSQSAQFIYQYNAHVDEIDWTTREAAQLNYQAGLMHYKYYTDANGTVKFSDRIQKAEPFFRANYENPELAEDFSERNICDCYYHICTFYKDFILDDRTDREPSREDFRRLFENVQTTLNSVEGAAANDKLNLYNGVFMLLYNCRDYYLTVDMEQETVLELFDEVYRKAEELKVSKESSQVLQMEMRDHYGDYRELIENAFVIKENG